MLARLLICSTFCFVFVNCYGNKMVFRRQSINSEAVGNPEFESCSERNFSRALKSNMNFFKCQPREAVVHLYSKEHNVEMIPNKVVVNRCYESGCYGMNSCLPSKTREVKVAVRMNYRVAKQQQQKCSWVAVTEHVECKCGCKVTKEDCERQNKKFYPKECTCKCRNEDQRKKCISQENMAWDEERCMCMCQTNYMESECSTGAVWVPQYCKCLQVMNMPDKDEDNDKFVYNTR